MTTVFTVSPCIRVVQKTHYMHNMNAYRHNMLWRIKRDALFDCFDPNQQTMSTVQDQIDLSGEDRTFEFFIKFEPNVILYLLKFRYYL
ncbi:hypothetical protein MADA3029_650168 [Vibrio nigripulchritudo MADA3029]|uniref:Uncharacterized protein n=1 Tax=Vibrio nigripulchritudo SOn1 TaxID=1238450 RepID=A0AAV2VMR2_9VIBR|nr:hypothetical protein VIBNIAM115_190014 [Vibrio nigripulchritudo AM115]CCN44517.1 hypothetical protein VIBNIFTn2_830014 [Vibrio nigripulchritudo FTn2]CCN48636.1 hypothetical protein VIBNIMADA3020_60138 [Vibrio nigripulchritudo MADA3020]CCN60844.1 hypothetical protein MADA3029_650168 [Vibrio nigripulchritudo MADA3029]CCN67780.1 hypothetical protein VIBNIPon4_870030 [Vibrio nigripulchritudo POn4]CCN77194.1 hypothetical protein VIBNISO65_210014 [Vibrio nigripulchritudo SO65]CCN81539.1 hypothet